MRGSRPAVKSLRLYCQYCITVNGNNICMILRTKISAIPQFCQNTQYGIFKGIPCSSEEIFQPRFGFSAYYTFIILQFQIINFPVYGF